MEGILQQRIDMMEAAFIDHEDGNLFLQLAITYREAGDADRALRVLRKGLESHPSYTPAFALLGEVLFESGRRAEAAVCFQQLLELDPSNERAAQVLRELAPAPVQTIVMAEPPAERDDAMPWEGEPKPHGDPLTHPVPGDDGTRHGEHDRSSPAPASPPAETERDATQSKPDVANVALRSSHAQAGLEAGLAADRPDSTAVALADLLVGLLEYRDPFFRGGTSLTRLLTAAIARELALDEETVDSIALGAVLRDLGQLPLKGLIDKPGTELGEDSRRKLERHVDTALELLEGVNLPQVARDTIRHHHERWDGKGYPDAQAGEQIAMGARIVAVADSFAAMIAARPHRLPKSVPAALEAIRSGSGTQYDPQVVDALVRVLSSTGWRGLQFSLRHHVLVVDPDETRAMVVATKLCSNGYLAEAAFSIESARERLSRTRIVAIVVSSELPTGDDVTLLRDLRDDADRLGMIPVIVTDAGVTERVRLLQAGADVCLSRGASFDELKATMEAFMRREGKPLPAGPGRAETPWAGLQGDIQDFPLAWLMQVLNYDSRTAAVFLVGNGDEGAIYLERGNPRHAQTRELSGEEAFRTMLRWPAGSFSVDPEATTAEQTIRASLMNLLLEQAVQDDHAAFFGAVKV